MYIKPPSERVLLENKQFVVNMVTEELAELLSRPLSLVLRDHSSSAVNAAPTFEIKLCRWIGSMVKAKARPATAAIQTMFGMRHRFDLDQCDTGRPKHILRYERSGSNSAGGLQR